MALIDRIKYNPESDDAIAWKFQSDNISHGAQLIVNESQVAIFFDEGKALNTFGPGRHTLSTKNFPFLRRLSNLPFGGETPFTAEVWYVNKTVKRDLKWGTKGPLQVVDPQYNYPISVRAFGSWGMRVTEAENFLTQIVGAQTSSSPNGYIGSERVEEYFTGEIVQRLSDTLAKFFVDVDISFFNVNAHLNSLSNFTTRDISPEFQSYGIEIVNFNVERISIPEEELKALKDFFDKDKELEHKDKELQQIEKSPEAYAAMRTFDTLEKAAENQSGGAGQLLSTGLGLGAGLGAGVPLGQKIGSAMNIETQADNPKESEPQDDQVAMLQQLKKMLEDELITEIEFNEKKKQILDSM